MFSSFPVRKIIHLSRGVLTKLVPLSEEHPAPLTPSIEHAVPSTSETRLPTKKRKRDVRITEDARVARRSENYQVAKPYLGKSKISG